MVINNKANEIKLTDLSLAEHKKIIIDWNATQKKYDKHATISCLFEKQAKQTPDAIAVVCGNDVLTYRELNEQANRLARYIRLFIAYSNNNANIPVLVGIFLERNIHLVVSMLAILKAGSAYVPLDPNYPDERIKYILQDTKTNLVLSCSKLRAKIKTASSDLLKNKSSEKIHIICLDNEWPAIKNQKATNLNLRNNPKNIAYVIYTSGSTGAPKGVLIRHQGVVSLINWAIREINTALKYVLFSTSICFDLSVFELFTTLSYGGKIYIVNNILDLIINPTKEKITLINTVPSSIVALLENKAIPKSLKTIILAGEPLSANTAESLYKIKNIKHLYNMYAPSETTTYSTCYRIDNGYFPHQLIGKPIDNTQIYILDTCLNPVAPGDSGEIYIGGDGLAAGYLRKPELTNERFILNPLISGDKSYFYKTGDLGRYCEDGNIEYLGRIDNQIKLRGYRIELNEIEACLLSYPGINHAAVVVHGKESKNQQLVAYIVKTKNHKLSNIKIDAKNIRNFLIQKLPGYMVPAVTAIKLVNQLPKTSNGKIDRKTLAEIPLQKTNNKKMNVLVDEFTQDVLAIWSNILKCNPAEINSNVNFFEFGGTSLNALDLIIQTNNKFKLTLSLYDIFSYANFEDYIKHIQKKINSNIPLIKKVLKNKNKKNQIPLTYEQMDKYSEEQNENRTGMNNLMLGYYLHGNLNINLFERSVFDLIKRHKILSANVITENNKFYWKQINTKKNYFFFHDVTRYLSTRKIDIVIRELITNQQTKKIDLSKDVLFKVELFKYQADVYFILIYIHHIIADLFSLNLLEDELLKIYQLKLNNEIHHLSPVKQYFEYCLAEEKFINSKSAIAKLQVLTSHYYRKKRLFIFNGKTDSADNTAGYLEISYPISLTKRIGQYAKTQGVSNFIFLLSIFNYALIKVFGQTSFATGSIISTRTHQSYASMIGLLVNYLVVHNDFEPNVELSKVLKQVKENTMLALKGIEIPYTLLRQSVNTAENNNKLDQTLFNIFFDYQDSSQVKSIDLNNLLVKEKISIPSSPRINRCLSFRVIFLNTDMKIAVRYKKALLTEVEVHKLISTFAKLCHNISKSNLTHLEVI